MTYAELRALFQGILNRDDIDTNQADTFITLGLRRVSRLLNTKAQITSYSLVLPAGFDGKVLLPADYLGVADVTLDGDPQSRVTLAQAEAGFAGYTIELDHLKISTEQAKEGASLALLYYNRLGPLPDADSGFYTTDLTDVVVYGALSYAADYFTDVRGPQWQALFQQFVSEARDADSFAETSGGLAISPQYMGIA